MSPGTARQLCCDTDVTPTTDRNGAILDVGRTARFPSSRQRRAVIARDRGCVGCGAPAQACHVHHHITWWDNGGRTDLDNLTLLCQPCHTGVHHFGWTVTRDHHRRYHATSPPGPAPEP